MADEDEKLKQEREKRRQEFLSWDAEHELPQAIGEYRFHRIDKQEGRIYYAFGWLGEKTGWDVRVLFDEETMDYMVKMYLHMVTMTEIECITGDLIAFKGLVKQLTPQAVERELIHRENVSILVKGKGFMAWDYREVLPETIGHYRRTIEPKAPLLFLNGSYIIAAYECQEKDTGVLFFYNIYRDEYYGELRAGGIPGIIHQYDASTVEDLEGKIRKSLAQDMQDLYDNPVIPE